MAFGRGKAILFGEHGVVYGHPALAAGLQVGVTADAQPADQTALHVQPWDLTVKPDDDTELGRALAAVCGLYPATAHIDAKVALPAGAGLGCSAALGVAVVRALDELTKTQASDQDVAERALAWERVFHGNPSGIDNTMAAFGGILVFQKGEQNKRVRTPNPLVLVVGHSGSASSTKVMVENVARQHDKEPTRINKTFEAMAAIVRNGTLALEQGELKHIGQLMDMNQALLSSLMLSTNLLEEMCTAARDAGALGAKLTGAGGGGCMIALVADDDKAEAVQQAIEGLGKAALIARVG